MKPTLIRPLSAIALVVALLLAQFAAAESVSPREQTSILSAAAALIEKRYVNAEEAPRIAHAIRQVAPKWRTPLDAKTFAQNATDLFREISGDGHLGLTYSEEEIPAELSDTGFTQAEMQRWYGEHINHGIERIERLPGNIMLLDLRVFPPPAMAADVIAAAMNLVAQGEALIIDLRNNGGGAETSVLLMGYLLEPGSPLSGSYHRPSDTHTHSSSPVWVPGRRFGAVKPLYILTSSKTFSAAEAVAYDLQALKRAVIVGEVTGGGAHPFEYRRIHPHFAVDLPEGKSVNPLTGGNWQDLGVQPDVRVPAEQALAKALALATAAIAAEN